MLLKDFYFVESEKKENGRCFTRLKINKGHVVYDGHFPGRPVTPGVILMQMFKEDAERRCGYFLKFQQAENVKFMAVVDPNLDPYLILDYELITEGDKVNLKGFAKTKSGMSMKINSLYSKK